MSDDCDGWTLSTLYTHLTGRMDDSDKRYISEFKAQKEAVGIALGASEKATAKAEEADNKRFESVNRFREALNDQNKMFVTRAELFGYMAALTAVITLVVSIFYYLGQATRMHP